MKKAVTFLSATAVSIAFASSAFACSMNKSASHDISPIASVEVETEEAMTTFDPQQVPTFETEVEATEEVIKKPVEEKTE